MRAFGPLDRKPRQLSDIEPDTECCGNCIYFDKFEVQKREDNRLGACKSRPPYPAADFGDSKLGVWPLTLATLWCGEFDSGEERE